MNVLVTGGTSGIGAAVVRLLVGRGDNVVFCARGTEKGRELELALAPLSGRALFVTCDVSDEGSIQRLMQETQKFCAGLDAAVNCAGISPLRSPLTQATGETYEEVFSINVKGVFLSMKHEMLALEAKGGVIVNLASVLGLRAVNLNHSIYTASKHAVVGLTKTAALEGARSQIRVNAVCPGAIDTPIHERNSADSGSRAGLISLHPLGRMGTAEEVAKAVEYLISPSAAFVTGCIFTMDGGAWL